MWTKDDLCNLVKEKLGDYTFVVVSNRQPYESVMRNGKPHLQRTPGGVVTALDPVMQACGGLWLTCGNKELDIKNVDRTIEIPASAGNQSYTLKQLLLTKKEMEGYYYGYANDALWPLCHMAFQRPYFRQEDWEAYCAVNRKFAEAIVEYVEDRKAFIWIQDYHFCMLAKYLREMLPEQLILAHFWHVPWPSYEAFRICPHQEQILDGLLSNDLLGFQVNYHCNNFMDVIDRTVESKIDRERFSVIRNSHETLIRPFPISIDSAQINTQAFNTIDENVDESIIGGGQLEGVQLLLGVDRIDFTKGIPERLLAFDRMLEKHPEMKEKVVLLQIGAISRIHLPRYKMINDEINLLVEQINWKHSTDRWTPIVFTRRSASFQELLGLFLRADVCIVSSLHDGMNLVAKEFVASRYDEQGVLVLSQFTGAARELKEAILVNPYDREHFSDQLYNALTMPLPEQQQRMIKLRNTITENDVFNWARAFILELLKFDFKGQLI